MFNHSVYRSGLLLLLVSLTCVAEEKIGPSFDCQQAKLEIAALLEACRRQQIRCACVMHGHGKNVLKQKVPLWLAQHPLVEAVHQAPREWGGDAALLVLIEQSDAAAASFKR